MAPAPLAIAVELRINSAIIGRPTKNVWPIPISNSTLLTTPVGIGSVSQALFQWNFHWVAWDRITGAQTPSLKHRKAVVPPSVMPLCIAVPEHGHNQTVKCLTRLWSTWKIQNGMSLMKTKISHTHDMQAMVLKWANGCQGGALWC